MLVSIGAKTFGLNFFQISFLSPFCSLTQSDSKLFLPSQPSVQFSSYILHFSFSLVRSVNQLGCLGALDSFKRLSWRQLHHCGHFDELQLLTMQDSNSRHICTCEHSFFCNKWPRQLDGRLPENYVEIFEPYQSSCLFGLPFQSTSSTLISHYSIFSHQISANVLIYAIRSSLATFTTIHTCKHMQATS